MREGELYRSLGFVRLGDYVAERLGFSYRGAQEMMRVEEALESLPLVAAAFDAGEITSGHVRLLARVAAAESEAFWVALARRTGVKALGRAVAAHIKKGEGGAREQDGGERERLDLLVPAWVAGLWRESATLVRHLVGSHSPPGACFEMVLAEVGDSVAGRSDDPQGSACDRGHSTRGEVHGSAPAVDQSAPGGVHTSARGSAVQRPATLDARAVDRELRSLFTERQRHDLRLAEHLRLVAFDRGYRDEGYRSLEEYAADRFGLSHGSLYNLLALRRRVEGLPSLKRAFLAGRLTARQASIVGSVATVLSVDAWVRRAQGVTQRRLEDEVGWWLQLKESRPSVWERLEGGPVPEGIALVPGHSPRLQRSARSGGAGCSLTAESFLRLLEEDEAATPLPWKMTVIRLWVEPEVRAMWEATLAHLRSAIRSDLREWEALAIVLREFWRVWDSSETRRQRRENPTLERDGWRCTAPGCRSVGTGKLHEHHIVFRSAGGSVEDPANRTTLCTGHHVGLLHEGRMACKGEAPDALVWEMGVEPGRGAFEIFRGETRVAGAAE